MKKYIGDRYQADRDLKLKALVRELLNEGLELLLILSIVRSKYIISLQTLQELIEIL